jgi:hypothetical protein
MERFLGFVSIVFILPGRLVSEPPQKVNAMPTARLKDIVEALDLQIDEYSSFLDRDTGKVEAVSDHLLRDAEDADDEEPDLPEWQKEEWEVAKRIVSTDRFLSLPTKYDVHEWEIMKDFSNSVKSDRIHEDLMDAIHGPGAFRSFKSAIRQHGIELKWFAFREEALRQIAIDWCEENKIAWE